MKKLFLLALIVFSTLATQHSSAQSVILINGQVTEVVLSGDDIESIVNEKMDNYLDTSEQESQVAFKYAKLRSPQPKIKTAPTADHQVVLTEDNQIVAVEPSASYAVKEVK